MNIFLTGGTGFIGSNLCTRLINEGHTVIAIARDEQKSRLLQEAGAKVIKGDLTEEINFEKYLENCEAIFHVASILGPQGMPYKFFHMANVAGTKKIVSAAMRMNVPRIIHFSSVGVLGAGSGKPVSEEARCNPQDAYEKTKYEAEQWIVQQAQHYQGITVIRPAWVYGPGDRRTFKLFNALKKGRFVFVGNGRGLQHPVYIDDLVEGTLLAAEKNTNSGEIFHLAGAEIITIHQMIEEICNVLEIKMPELNVPYYPMKLAGKICEYIAGVFQAEPPLSVAKVDFFVKNRSYSIEKAEKILGFRPVTNFSEGLRKTINWYKEKQWL